MVGVTSSNAVGKMFCTIAVATLAAIDLTVTYIEAY